MEETQLSLKFVLVGEAGVGKSSMATKFCDDHFDPNQQHTVGVEFYCKVVKVGRQPLKLQLWDTAGQERFRSITKAYFRAAAAVFIVFDVTRRDSFSAVCQWFEDAQNLTQTSSIKTLIGNKVDLNTQRDVTFEEASTLAEQYNMKYYETSALSGERLKDVFIDTAETVLESIRNGTVAVNAPNSGIRTSFTPFLKNQKKKTNEADGGRCC